MSTGDTPIRDHRRVAVIAVDTNDRKAWTAACEKARDAVREAMPDRIDHLTDIEPYGLSGGVFEWRIYCHSESGLEAVYAAIRQADDE